MQESKHKIEYLKTSDLSVYEKNARTHSEIQIQQIAASIREFGFTNPVLIDSEDGIIAGHGRVMAARKLGLAEVPCIRLGHLTETQKRAYIIADNKLALNSGWDEEMLGLELADLREADFDLDLIGFDAGEIEPIVDDTNDELTSQKIGELFEVIAECENEDQQNMVYNLLNEREIKCRLSIL
jgi:ParB-like chromosome segregation protein Spo0J